MMGSSKRVFFAFSVEAPWPQDYPKGRLVSEPSRHMTIAFLGSVDQKRIQNILSRCPSFPQTLGPCGVMNQLLFLPPRRSRVVAAHVQLGESVTVVETFYEHVHIWLEHEGFTLRKQSFLPHVTLARSPFKTSQWTRQFHPLPLKVTGFHLYESMPQLNYVPIWGVSLKPPFEEMAHTADRGFIIRGAHYTQLLRHAWLALAWLEPTFLDFLPHEASAASLVDAIKTLNDAIAHVDAKQGCPLKSVSYSGEPQWVDDVWMEWEMICDV